MIAYAPFQTPLASRVEPATDTMRPKAKFLTVVWGEAYITRFATLALPSFLAPGNLPALAEATELEVVIMTRAGDIDYFRKHDTFHRLSEICAVRFVEIDDLIATSVYGVTLTLAYARPVIACGREMLATHFVFMNADFVLADGSLRALGRHILAGRSIVLGPSFRATAEAVEPALQAAVDPTSGVLAVPPRRLAALSLPHPHPTTIAKTVNQGVCHSTHPNQFFWQVDEQTLLGRYYLIFMLCLKPERIVETINCYCDYSFIPEMCPSGDEAVMDDSDDFFMLELQGHEQEMHMLRLGRQTDEEISRSLQQWTTAEHRRAAGHDIVFHAGEVPAGIEAAKAEARAFVERIGRRLHRPVPHGRHQYWIRGVEAWRQLRKAKGLSASPPELATSMDHFERHLWRPLVWKYWSLYSLGHNVLPVLQHEILEIPGRVTRRFWSLVYFSYRVLFGQPPRVTVLHPDWMDFMHLRDTLAVLLAEPGARLRVVRDQPELVDELVAANAAVRLATLKEAFTERPPASEGVLSGDTHVLIYLQHRDYRSALEFVARCQSGSGPALTCQIFIHSMRGDISREVMPYIDDLVSSPRASDCSFVGGTLKHFNRMMVNLVQGLHSSFGLWALPLVLVVTAIVLPLILIGNLSQVLIPRNRRSGLSYCSSAAIRFDPVMHPPRERARS